MYLAFFLYLLQLAAGKIHIQEGLENICGSNFDGKLFSSLISSVQELCRIIGSIVCRKCRNNWFAIKMHSLAPILVVEHSKRNNNLQRIFHINFFIVLLCPDRHVHKLHLSQLELISNKYDPHFGLVQRSTRSQI